jgi:hypothetical protein
MSIRIPPDAEQNLRIAFEDVEDRLISIESGSASSEAPIGLEQIRADIALLQSKMNTLDLYRDADEAQSDFKENNPLRVLHEDGIWKEPLDGIAKAVPAGLGTGRADTDGEREGQPSQILNVLGSLAVTGALSAETVRARLGRIGMIYSRGSGSANKTISTGTVTDVDLDGVEDDPWGFHSTAVNSFMFTVPTGYGGFYYFHGGARWEAEGSPAGFRSISVEKNSDGTPTTGNIIALATVHPTVNSVLDLNVPGFATLADGDTLEFYCSHTQGGDTDVVYVNLLYDTPMFEMIRLGGL